MAALSFLAQHHGALLTLAQAFLGAGYLAAAVYLGYSIQNQKYRPAFVVAFALAVIHLANLTTPGSWHDHPAPFQLLVGLTAVVAVRRNEVLYFVLFSSVILMQVEFIQITRLSLHWDPSWATAETLIGGAVLTVIADFLWIFTAAVIRGFKAAQV